MDNKSFHAKEKASCPPPVTAESARHDSDAADVGTLLFNASMRLKEGLTIESTPAIANLPLPANLVAIVPFQLVLLTLSFWPD
ncbi:hypothetical protein [Rhodopirellula sp. MGV]|uniref:hypothetical protein n=1 Tax=Rhodopirellula sp. MGV TaxID=2023130 RepID=UPI000BC7605C|nr:hypothetical protein [Rhodopirellula sp. MGV]OYP33898.1 hypothetical protein CGZ80_17060 [Rhodopirellula sp. MGV]